MRKKIIPLFFLILLVIGCENIRNTPTAKVESLFSKYQKMDKEIINELDNILNKDDNIPKDLKKEYKELLIRQYQNISYKIVKEETQDNYSTVTVEIEVLDYKYAIDKTNDIKAKITEMKKVNTMRKYTLDIYLIKDNNNWIINELSNEDRQKIHGLY